MVAESTNPQSLHSRVVWWTKLILPVVALGLLSTLFLLARTVDPDNALPIADVDVTERAREQQLTAPRFAGVSANGTTFALSATRAKPDAADPRRMTAEDIRLTLTMPEGGDTTVRAGLGEVDTGSRDIALAGDIRIETPDGFALRTERLQGSLGQMMITAPGEIIGIGPLGKIRAGAMQIGESPEGDRGLLFTGGVELLYLPPG